MASSERAAKVRSRLRWTPFRKGVLVGALVVLLVWGIVWWTHRGVYACVAWGHAGKTASCHIHDDKTDGWW